MTNGMPKTKAITAISDGGFINLAIGARATHVALII